MKRLIIALALLLPSAGQALVDMKNANYVDSWLDLTLPGTGFDLRVQRTYNSRSVFIGMFGFGWCSDFETSLEKTPEGNLKLTECGGGLAVTYSPGASDSKEVDKTIQAILDHQKKNNKAANAKYLATLKEQLMDNSALRATWAKTAGLEAPALKKGTVFSANGREIEKIVFDGEFYVRSLPDGSMQKFNDDGRLVHLGDKNGNHIKLSYADDLLKEVVDNNGRKLAFNYYPNKKVKEITGPNNIKVTYKFDSEDLTEVKNAWTNTFKYKYDDNHNLTLINYPDKTSKVLTYNQKQDWVTSFTDQDKCVETYDYQTDKQNPRDHFWAVAEKKCGKEVVNNSRFEFWHKVRDDGRKYLYRVLTKTQSEEMDVIYHEGSGRPISIRKNGATTTFAYFGNGLIKERSTSAFKMAYEYNNPHVKVSRVLTEFFDPKGKVIKKRETNFNYDGKGNIASASNSDGQSVTLSYDHRGRIASISDQAKKEVFIKYDERFSKPSVITRPKVGSINVIYKANGDIKKVESKDGPTVAVQVASTFNTLLDVISPATSELAL